MRGKLIAIEGSDGSGKKTQTQLLLERLEIEGHQTRAYRFPRYGETSAHFVEHYLRGDYPANKTNPYQATFFFAMDRYESTQLAEEELDAGMMLVSDRYTTSSLAHLGGRLPKAERPAYFAWGADLEHKYLGIPKPDRVIMLHIPAVLAQKLAGQKQQPLFNDTTSRDIHEADLDHLKNAEEAFLEICHTDSELYRIVRCMDGERLKSVEEIQALVWEQVNDLLAG